MMEFGKVLFYVRDRKSKLPAENTKEHISDSFRSYNGICVYLSSI